MPANQRGWELGKPRPILVELVENGEIPPGQALDLCCGAGTNTIYLAQKGFKVTGIDISPTALKIAKQQATEANVQIGFLNGSFADLAFAEEFLILFLTWAAFTMWSQRIEAVFLLAFIGCLNMAAFTCSRVLAIGTVQAGTILLSSK